ncbi:MAG TPA: hypothetical protein PK083_07635, partial [Soehngenia sp.]|nr:hypothetical protein [Soehngenia sp.]
INKTISIYYWNRNVIYFLSIIGSGHLRPPQKSGHKDKLEIILYSHIKSLLDVKNQKKIH